MLKNLFRRNQLRLLNKCLGEPQHLDPRVYSCSAGSSPANINCSQIPAGTEEMTSQNLLFLPLNTNSFHFPEKHCMVCCSASWSLWHVERVISPSGCNCHHKAFNKFKKQHQDQGTNGRRDELLTIFDYLIQLEPFLIAKMPKHSQSHSYSTQKNHQSSPKFWLLPTIKMSSQLHIKWCQGKHCFSSSPPTLLGVQLHATVVFFF